jgi:glycosyltransferase involved in cell wall biosynthesis
MTRVLMLVINPMTADARVEKEAASLAASGAQVTILATTDGESPPREEREGVTIIRLPYQRVVKDRITGSIETSRGRGTLAGRIRSRGLWLLGGSYLKFMRSRLLPIEYYRGLAHLALERVEPPTVIHAHDLGTLRAAVKLSQAWRRRTSTRPKVVYDSHELYVEQQTRWAWWEKALWREHERRWIRHADAVITVSGGIADELQRRYHLGTRPQVILNSPQAKSDRRLGRDVRHDLGLDPALPVAVYAGAVKPNRGIGQLVDAMQGLAQWHLALVGTTPESLEMVLEGRPYPPDLAARVHTVPPVPSWSLPEYLSTATVGVHPLPGSCLNHRLALPNKLFDYLFAGLPVVVSDLPEMGALVRDRAVGTTYDTGRPDLLAGALEATKDLLVSPSAIEDLSWDHQETLLRALYDSLL